MTHRSLLTNINYVISALFTCVASTALLSYVLTTPSPISGGSSVPWPSLILVCMVVGDTILRKELAVYSGFEGDYQFGVPIGFGYLNYMISTLTSITSSTSGLVPEPEFDCTLMNMKSGKSRKNKSWFLARVLQNLEKHADDGVAGLVVSVYEGNAPGGLQGTDRGFLSFDLSCFTCALQTTIAWIPAYYCGDPLVLLLTYFGISLSCLITQLPAWENQKFSARRDGGKNDVYALIRGKNHRHVVIIRNTHGEALNLEDLAAASSTDRNWIATDETYVIYGVTLGWLLFTVLAARLQQFGAYLFAIMVLGTVSNLITAALPWSLSAHGLPLKHTDSISGPKVMNVLQDLETAYPGYGENLLKTFFPGSLQLDEELWWAQAKEERRKQREEDIKKLSEEKKQTESNVEAYKAALKELKESWNQTQETDDETADQPVSVPEHTVKVEE